MSVAAEALPLIIREPSSLRADAFRVLRVRLEQSLAPERLRSVLVTSPGWREKRHEVAANLAAAYAECGVPALLLDADLHRPALHELFDVALAPGLLQALNDPSAGGAAIQPGPLTGLSLLTAGGTDAVPARLLGSRSLETVLAGLVDADRVLIVVAPPILAAADASLLAAHVDGVVLVTAALRTSRTSLRDAKQRLEGSGARILGAVLDGATSLSF
ncbi:MAG: CpsD/CapB family tyrosine-protein kinase [Anaerolineae bacterium]